MVTHADETSGFLDLEKARDTFLRNLNYLPSFTFIYWYIYYFTLFKVGPYLLGCDNFKEYMIL